MAERRGAQPGTCGDPSPEPRPFGQLTAGGGASKRAQRRLEVQEDDSAGAGGPSMAAIGGESTPNVAGEGEDALMTRFALADTAAGPPPVKVPTSDTPPGTSPSRPTRT